MKYQDALKESMEMLSQDKRTVFLGYNTKCGSRCNGSLKDVADEQIIETPLAENLMMGMAIGLSLEGYRPVVYFERFDFIFNAIDSIVNHLDKLKGISDGEYNPVAIIRVVVGNTQKPLFTGATHVQDYSEALDKLVSFPVITCKTDKDIMDAYKIASNVNFSIMIVEYKDLYE